MLVFSTEIICLGQIIITNNNNLAILIREGLLTKILTCRREEFVQWVEMLPDTQTPSWLGLPNNAEKVLLTTQGKNRTLAITDED